jgi:hydroxymethylbilane synthase
MLTRGLRIGTRGSKLALAQATLVRDTLAAAHPALAGTMEIVEIRTTGDRVQDRKLSEIGGKGLFTKEIEEQLLAGAIDIAVHSTKDMPTRQPDGLLVAAFLPREDPRDVLVAAGGIGGIADLPLGATVATVALRRQALLLHRRADLRIEPIRGNIDTRLRKLVDGAADALILARAGLNRLGLGDIGLTIPAEEMLPAVGQGAVCIECRTGHSPMRELPAAIDHPQPRCAYGQKSPCWPFSTVRAARRSQAMRCLTADICGYAPWWRGQTAARSSPTNATAIRTRASVLGRTLVRN